MAVTEKPRWLEPEIVDVPAEMIELCKGSRFFADILVRRGLHSKSDALPFLYPDRYHQSDPFDFPTMEKAVHRLADALSNEEKIGIWGDFDADGQTATALLVNALSKLTPQIFYQIPVRAQNSHGINIEGLNNFIHKNISLMITCDTGVGEYEEIEYAINNGIEVIITDHHKLPEITPEAVAIINPHYLSSKHPMASLSGVGVAYKFIEAAYQHLGKPKAWLEDLLDLVAIGTIADLVPLTGESRYLAQRGIISLRETTRPGLIALLEQNGIRQNFINEETISFSIAPRLNAMGRLGNANKNIELLTTSSMDYARELITELERLNIERKKLSEMTKSAAIDMIEKSGELATKPIIFLSSPGWETSVTGIVASALAERYKMPTFIISEKAGKHARGSARSVAGIDIAQVLHEHQDLLLRFGGHPMASGFALEHENIKKLQRGAEKSISQQIEVGFPQEPISVDAYIPLHEANNLEFLEQLELLRPFGQSNPAVTLLDTEIRLLNVFHFGKSENHRRLLVETKSNTQHSIVWWKSIDEPFPADCFNLLYTIKFSYYRGRREVQVEYIDSIECSFNDDNNYTLSSRIEIVDLREIHNPIDKISEILANKEVMIYGEGFHDKTPKFTVFNRFQMQPCDVLVLATIPPDYKSFHSVIQLANPKKLILLKPIAGKQLKTSFIAYLTNCLLDAIKTSQGYLQVNELAAATGHRKSTIIKALDFLVEKTTLSYIEKNDETIQIGNFGKPSESAKSRMLEMDDLLEETAAFRRFYMRSNLNNLIQTIDLD